MGQRPVITMGDTARNPIFILGFPVRATAECTTLTIPWLTRTTDKLVRVEQWPLTMEKLSALESRMEKQLSKGHIVPSDSPWNSPVFVIRKPSRDRWRLLHNLHEISKAIVDMGSLQPAMPSPSMLP